MISELDSILRRIKPEKRILPLKPRNASELAFLGPTQRVPAKLLYDTTVYIDILQGRFPRDGESRCELPTLALNGNGRGVMCTYRLSRTATPGHGSGGETARRDNERRPAHRTLAPDREIWLEAGILVGVLTRLQQYSAADRHRVLNDALLFATARKHGLTVLTRNLRDFDLLQQLEPSCAVLFYS